MQLQCMDLLMGEFNHGNVLLCDNNMRRFLTGNEQRPVIGIFVTQLEYKNEFHLMRMIRNVTINQMKFSSIKSNLI